MIEEIERSMKKHIAEYQRDNSGALLDALTEIVEPGVLRQVAGSITSDARTLDTAVQRSSIHNNGFLKIILSSSPNYQVRLHVWDCRDGMGEAVLESVHSHTADFASMIVAGGYQHEQFRTVDDGSGEEYHSYVYHAQRGARSFALEDAGMTRLQKVSDGRYLEGTVYSLAGDILHRVVPLPGILTASLVIQGPGRYSFVQVISEEPIDAGRQIPVKDLEKDKLVRYIGEVSSSTTFC